MADARGSIAAVTDAGGAAVAINSYDPYGLPASGNVGRFQYTGQMRITAGGLHHYKARAYHPMLGRFLQPDPLGYGDGMNIYAYVGGDPVNARDPSGLLSSSNTEGCRSTVNSSGCAIIEFINEANRNTTGGTPRAALTDAFGNPCKAGFVCLNGAIPNFIDDVTTSNSFNINTKFSSLLDAAKFGFSIGSKVGNALGKLLIFDGDEPLFGSTAAEIATLFPPIKLAKLPRIGKIIGDAVPNAEQIPGFLKFQKKIPANATDVVILHKLPNNGLCCQAFSPARNIPGSFAEHLVQLDSHGHTLSRTITTFGPNGDIIKVTDKFLDITIKN